VTIRRTPYGDFPLRPKADKRLRALSGRASVVRPLRVVLYAVPFVAILGAVAYYSLPLAGIVYLLAFMLIAIVNTPVALLITFASASFIVDLSLGPFKLSFGEISLAVMFPVTLIRAASRRGSLDMGPLAVPATLYVGVCALSTILNWDSSAVNAMLQMLIYLFIAVLVFSSTIENPIDLYPSLTASVAVGAFLAVAAIVTDYHFLKLNKNAWGAIMSTLVVIAVELWFSATDARRKRYLMGAIMLLGSVLFMSLSRGAWMGTIAGVFVIILLRRQFGLGIRLACILIPLIAVLWFVMPQAERDYAVGFETERGNIRARYVIIDYCTSLFLSHPILGVGITLRKEVDATNIIMITLAETGIVGLALFLLLHFSFFRMIWKLQSRVPRTHAFYSLLAVAAALVARCLFHGLVDHYWSRGPILQAWGAAGMAICAARTIRRGGKPVPRRRYLRTRNVPATMPLPAGAISEPPS
jgi:hypothetical protein